MGVIERKRTFAKAKAKKKPYSRYQVFKKELRLDFRFSCGYCETWERQAGGSGNFGVDHFIAKIKRPELICDPSNLIYACNSCNRCKGDGRIKPDLAEIGIGYLDPCLVDYKEHFEITSEGLLEPLNQSAEFMIIRLRLNSDKAVAYRLARLQLQEAITYIHKFRKLLFSLPTSTRPIIAETEDEIEINITGWKRFVGQLLPRKLD